MLGLMSNTILGQYWILSVVFSAGFGYKTFMGLPPFEWGKGTGWWMQYEIYTEGSWYRTASANRSDCYDRSCVLRSSDLGSGPTGLSSAVAAAKKGMDVILVEQDFLLGGQLLNSGDEKKEEQRLSLTHEIEKLGVRVFTRTTAFGLYDHGTAGLLERVSESVTSFSPHIPRQRFWIVRANTTILATGAIERSIAFGNNDRPGVMTVSSGQAYLNRFGILPGKKIVIATNNDSVYQTAKQLALAGAEVKIFDTRSAQAIYEHDAYQIIAGTMPFEVYGRKFVKRVGSQKRIN